MGVKLGSDIKGRLLTGVAQKGELRRIFGSKKSRIGLRWVEHVARMS
jgi:hypothetical protein